MTEATVRVAQVIETTLTIRGTGAPGDGVRRVTQYWSFTGALLAENDPQVTGRGEVLFAPPEPIAGGEVAPPAVGDAPSQVEGFQIEKKE